MEGPPLAVRKRVEHPKLGNDLLDTIEGPCCGSKKVEEPSPCCAPVSEPEPELAPEPQKTGLAAYLPLIVIVLNTAAATAALQLVLPAGSGRGLTVMRTFMGLFLVVFSMFKLFDLKGFAAGFAKYDLAAKAFAPYGYLYPFLELGFGLALLANWQMMAVNGALAGLMFFGSVGVFLALKKGLNLKCACLGSTLNVPLSTVAVVEDLGMGVMALAMMGMLSA